MANILFNILVARLYRAFMKIIGDRGVLFSIIDDVKIASPPSVLAEIVAQLSTLSLAESGFNIQASKNRVYVPPSARETWKSYLETNPRNSDPTILCLHGNPDGRLLEEVDIY